MTRTLVDEIIRNVDYKEIKKAEGQQNEVFYLNDACGKNKDFFERHFIHPMQTCYHRDHLKYKYGIKNFVDFMKDYCKNHGLSEEEYQKQFYGHPYMPYELDS